MNTHMDRAIFHLGVSVLATSLYILVCALMDEGQLPTLDRIRTLWNGTEEDLTRAVRELTSRGILQSVPAWVKDGDARLYLSSDWRRIVQAGNSPVSLESADGGCLA